MKASINGVPHLSVGDGWWAEGYTGRNGWLIHGSTLGDPPETADEADAQALYRLLEEQVVPAFYDRDKSGVPRRWLKMVREAIRTVAPHFSARRMVKQYVQDMYRPTLDRVVSTQGKP
jgi:starch phosphorylase